MSTTDLTEKNRRAVTKAHRTVECFRALNSEMPVGEIASFLLIASGQTKDGGGLTVTELARHGGVAMATASRYLASLSVKNRRGEPGHDLVTSPRDPMNDARKILRLTPKGVALVEHLQKILGD